MALQSIIKETARLPVRFLRAPFGPMAKDKRCCHCARAPMLCRRLALALALALALLLVLLRWLLLSIRALLTLLIRRYCCFKRYQQALLCGCSCGCGCGRAAGCEKGFRLPRLLFLL
jgi:hypothetical protein